MWWKVIFIEINSCITMLFVKQNNVSTLLKETNYQYLCICVKFEWTKIYRMHIICKKIFKIFYKIYCVEYQFKI